MIFVTVGTQLPFPRLINAISLWNENGKQNIIAQIGSDDFIYRNIKHFKFIEANVIENYMRKASLIVGHAGIGTVLSTFEYQKPLILYPRLAENNEHRNDHQLATCRKFEKYQGIYIAYSDDELYSLLANRHELLPCSGKFSVSQELEQYLSEVMQ